MFDRLVNAFKKFRRGRARRKKGAVKPPQLADSSGPSGVGQNATPHQQHRDRTKAFTPRPIPEPPKTLLWAVSNGREEVVRQLLRDGADASTTSAAEISVLHIAARDGSEPIVRLLLEAGAAPSARDPDTGVTALHRAAERGHPGAAVRLLRAGADIDAKTIGGMTPLHEAARNGHRNVVHMLLHFGADPAITNVDGVTALQLAANGTTAEVFEHLAEQDGNATLGNGAEAPWAVEAVDRRSPRVGAEGMGLIYDSRAWDEYWEDTMERLRRDTAFSKPQPEPLPPAASDKPNPSQAISWAVDSGKLSQNLGFAILR